MPSKESRSYALQLMESHAGAKNLRETKRRTAQIAGYELFEALNDRREVESRAASETRLRKVVTLLEEIKDDRGLCKQFVQGVFDAWRIDHPIRQSVLETSENPVTIPQQFGYYFISHFEELQAHIGAHPINPITITFGLYHALKKPANTDDAHLEIVSGMRKGLTNS